MHALHVGGFLNGPDDNEVRESVQTANGGLNGRAGLHGVDPRVPIRRDCTGQPTSCV